MKNKLHFTTLILTIFFALSETFASNNNSSNSEKVAKLRQTYIDLVTSTSGFQKQVDEIAKLPKEAETSDYNIIEIFQKLYPITESDIYHLISSLRSDGSWADVDYKAKNMSGWKPKDHIERLLDMVKFYRTMQGDCKQFTKDELLQSTRKVMNYWFDIALVSPNWWHNLIGTPKVLGQALILFRDYMSSEELKRAQEVMLDEFNIRFKLAGQNWVWACESRILASLLCDDYDKITQMRNEFVKEIVVGNYEGIQNDWTFHQHGSQQQMGNYGMSYYMTMSFYSHLFADTELSFTPEQQKILNNLCLEGFRWMTWGNILDINAMNRHINHNGERQKGIGSKFTAYYLIRNSDKEDQKKLKSYINDGDLLGHKYFENSELTIHRTKNWMVSIRTSSNKLIGVESCNGDGRNASFMGDGAIYLYNDYNGKEYENIYPLWNPRLIPGITTIESTESALDKVARNKTDFVFGATDQKSGITSMELNRYGAHALKSWIVTDEWILCLGSDIHSDNGEALTTSIAQRNISNSNLYKLNNTGEWSEITNSEINSSNNSDTSLDSRFFHDGVGYIALGKNNIVAERVKTTGDWHDVCTFYTKGKLESGEILSIYLRHSNGNESYQYFILPESKQSKVAKFDTSKVNVIYNNKDIHAVEYKGTYYIAVRKAGDYNLPFANNIDISKEGVYMVKNGVLVN